jgi:hypothetical protein
LVFPERAHTVDFVDSDINPFLDDPVSEEYRRTGKWPNGPNGENVTITSDGRVIDTREKALWWIAELNREYEQRQADGTT